MSPEALEIAMRQTALRLKDADLEFIGTWDQMASKFAAGGALQSSRFALHARQVCEKELQRRGEMVWAIFCELLDGEGLSPSEDNRGQFRALLQHALAEKSSMVKGVLLSRIRGILTPDPTLDEGLDHAIESAMATCDGGLHRMAKRRPPLEDELSAPRYHAAKAHWHKALEHAAKEQPDLPNALKEAVSSVESMAQIVLQKPGLVLGDAVKQLRSNKQIPPGANDVLDGLWTLANTSPGARHGSSLAPNVEQSHWIFAKATTEASLRLLLDVDVK